LTPFGLDYSYSYSFVVRGLSQFKSVLNTVTLTRESEIMFNLKCEWCSIFYVHVTVHRNKFHYNKTNQMHQFPKFTPA